MYDVARAAPDRSRIEFYRYIHVCRVTLDDNTGRPIGNFAVRLAARSVERAVAYMFPMDHIFRYGHPDRRPDV